MRADRDAVLDRQLDRFAHDVRIAPMEPAGDVGRGEVRHDLLVHSELPATVALAHVGIEVDELGHGETPYPRAFTRASALMKRSTSSSVIAREQAPRPRWVIRMPSFRSPRNTRIAAPESFAWAERWALGASVVQCSQKSEPRPVTCPRRRVAVKRRMTPPRRRSPSASSRAYASGVSAFRVAMPAAIVTGFA